MDTGVDRPVIQRYLNSPEAAIYLGTTECSLRKMRERGLIPFFKVGSRVKFDRFDLDAWMTEHRQEAWAS